MKILKKLSVVVFLTLLSSCSTLGEATRVDREFVDLDDISITTSSGSVTVGKSTDNKVYLTYYEYDAVKYDIEHDANKLVLKKQWKNGSYTGKLKGVTILIPTTLSGTFNARSSSGDMTINGVTTSADITLSSSSGDIIVKNSTTSAAISLGSSSGAVKLDRLEANNIIITSSSGDIYGSIVGNQSDFTIGTSSSSGSVYPPSVGGSGSKNLAARTSSGDINIRFVR